MNCSRVSNQLSAYIDRELTGVEMLQVRRHLDGCEECRSEYESLCGMKMLLGRLRTAEATADLAAATVRRFEQTSDVWRQAPVASRQSPIEALLDLLRPRFDAFSHWRLAPSAWRLPLPLWRLVSGAAALLLAGLILSTVYLQRSRPSDALIATSPVAVLTGQDPLNYVTGEDWDNPEVRRLPTFEPRLYERQLPFGYANVSYDGWRGIR
jgi:anti-sigma factor RsiW